MRDRRHHVNVGAVRALDLVILLGRVERAAGHALACRQVTAAEIRERLLFYERLIRAVRGG